MQERQVESGLRLRWWHLRRAPIAEPRSQRRLKEQSPVRVKCGRLRREYRHLGRRILVWDVDGARAVFASEARVAPPHVLPVFFLGAATLPPAESAIAR